MDRGKARPVKRGRRFLLYSLGSVAAGAAAGRLIARKDGRRPDPESGEHLGALRGEPRFVRGPRTSRLYTEWFPPAEASAGTLIFTHGWCLTEAVWHYQKRDLAGGPFGIVTWDLPGHGHSTPVAAGRLSLEIAAEALSRVIKEYTNGGALLVGHSLGGVVTMAALARSEELRSLVRGTVLVSTPMMHPARAVAGRWPGAALEERAVGRLVEYVVRSRFVDRLIAKDVGDDELNRLSYNLVRVGFGRNPSPSQVRFIRDVIASVPPDVRSDTYRAMANYDLVAELPKVRTPTLVIVGPRDRLVNPEESKALAGQLPQARIVTLEDAGHASFLTAHEPFNTEVRRFAERRLARSRRSSVRRRALH